MDHISISGNSMALTNRNRFAIRAFNRFCRINKDRIVRSSKYTCRVREGNVQDVGSDMDDYITLVIEGQLYTD